MKIPTISEVIKSFKDVYGVTITEDQAKDHIAFIKKCVESVKDIDVEGEMSDDEAAATAGGALNDGSKSITRSCPRNPSSTSGSHVFSAIPGQTDLFRCIFCGMCVTREMMQYVDGVLYT